MPINKINLDRKSLEFPEMVIEHFSFLEQELGYSVVQALDTFVQYRYKVIFVNVYHGRSSYEVGFEIGRSDMSPTRRYHYSVILKAVAPEYKGQVFLQADNKEALRFCIDKIAQIAKTYCQSLFIGDDRTWKALEHAGEVLNEELYQEYTIRPVKNRALEAWQRRDFKEVIRLYESVEKELNDIERKRFFYAKKKIDELKKTK